LDGVLLDGQTRTQQGSPFGRAFVALTWIPDAPLPANATLSVTVDKLQPVQEEVTTPSAWTFETGETLSVGGEAQVRLTQLTDLDSDGCQDARTRASVMVELPEPGWSAEAFPNANRDSYQASELFLFPEVHGEIAFDAPEGTECVFLALSDVTGQEVSFEQYCPEYEEWDTGMGWCGTEDPSGPFSGCSTGGAPAGLFLSLFGLLGLLRRRR
jgi:MYXO-CTERM domain-containing protein